MEDMKSKVESIAGKYGYRVKAYTQVDSGTGQVVPVLSFTAVDRSKFPDVFFNRYSEEPLEGIDRFFINHSAGGNMSIKEETEFVRNVTAAIQMCKEINELDLEDLPRLSTTESVIRSRIMNLSDRISRC